MAWPNIDVNVPTGSEKKKFGDDRIRESKQNTVDAMQAISNFTPAGTQPALRTVVWTTDTRPTGVDLVDRVTGLNADLGCEEFYDLASTTWKVKGNSTPSWNVAGRPTGVSVGYTGYNTDLAVIERWNGSAWIRIAGGYEGEISMAFRQLSNIPTGWVLCDGVTRTHPEGHSYTPPNLFGRFIIGADGAGYPLMATGGEAVHTLTIGEMPTHAHLYIDYGEAPWGAGDGSAASSAAGYTQSVARYTSSTGGGAAHENRPPYYALCFIYKL